MTLIGERLEEKTMVIIRDGKKIELTDEEMTRAYYEQQHKWDMKYVSTDIPYWAEEDWVETTVGLDIVKRLQNDNEFCDKVAHRYRKYLEDIITGEDEQYCWEDACDYVISWENVSS